MKKQILIFVLSCLCANSYAQYLTQGTHLISGSFSFSSYTEKRKSDGNTVTDSKDTEISFTPAYGYTVMDNLVIGGALAYTSDVTKYEDDSFYEKDSFTYFTVGPVVRYYILDNGLFAMGYYGIGSGNSKTTYSGSGDDDETKFSVSEWRLGVGYSIRLSETVLLDPVLSYGGSTWNDKDADIKYLSSGHFMIQVGFTVYFPK